MELHTFVIPVYKESPFLEACILSLKEQIRASPVILTTSTPTDYSRDLARKYNLLYVVNDKIGAGIAGDWNFALAQAPSRFVTLAHQDNLYERTYTETVLNALAGQEHRSPILAFTGYSDLIGEKLRARSLNHLVKNILLLPFHLKPAIRSKSIKKAVLLLGNPIGCPTVTFNKDRLGSFAFSSAYQYTVDWHAWLQLAGNDGAFVFINKMLMQHRLHPGSETSRQLGTGQRKWEEKRLFEEIWGPKIARFLSWIYETGHKNNQLGK